MDIKYMWVIWLGAVVALGMVISLFIRNKKKGNTYEGGKKIAGPLYSRDEDYFKRKMTVYRSFADIEYCCCRVCICDDGQTVQQRACSG